MAAHDNKDCVCTRFLLGSPAPLFGTGLSIFHNYQKLGVKAFDNLRKSALKIQSKAIDTALSSLYALDRQISHLELGKQQVIKIIETMHALFSPKAEVAPSWTEFGGNHIDHQHGHVLCASVDMDILAYTTPKRLDAIRIHSDT